MKRNIYVLIILTTLIFQSCGIKTAKEVGLHFSTEKSKLPDQLNWKKIGFAKELINQECQKMLKPLRNFANINI